MDTLIGCVIGIVFASIVFYIYLRHLMYGGTIFVDRTYDRPDIYLELSRRYEDPCDIAKCRHLLLKVRVIKTKSNSRNNHAL